MIRHYITSRGQDLFVDVRGDTVWTAHDRSGPWVDLADPRPFHTAVEKGYLRLADTLTPTLACFRAGEGEPETVAVFSEDEEAEFDEWMTRIPKVRRTTSDELRTTNEAEKPKKRGRK